jgi:deoxyribodipyrimidine photo-lyase
MTANRRLSWNHALDVAVEHANTLGLPLVVLEPLRVGYRWASDRFHAFVAQGMADNAAAADDAGVAYYPYLEPEAGAGAGLLEALATDAAVVVGDDWPCFFLPTMIAAAATKLDGAGVAFDIVDSVGLLPMRAAGDQVFPTAYAFRRFLQKTLPAHLFDRPSSSPFAPDLPRAPLSALVPDNILARWPRALDLSGSVASLSSLPIDHGVAPVAIRGGAKAAQAALQAFMAKKLSRYHEDRSPPDLNGQSGLSPWLHWGHISTHQIVDAVFRAEDFSPDKLAPKATGSREGWWGMSVPAEAFLDELITWRELGFNMSSRRDDYDQWDSLPEWARKSLLEHMSDARSHSYTLDELDGAKTHDPLWNAAQKQLKAEGVIHNYLRMLWGKKVLEWSPDPRLALENLIELNNRYAIDGRDPNSYSGIFWVFGRYDRPWGPTRPIFGVIRYMTSENTQKKHACKQYLQRYNGEPPGKTATSGQPRLL